jgi:hypothetical protein
LTFGNGETRVTDMVELSNTERIVQNYLRSLGEDVELYKEKSNTYYKAFTERKNLITLELDGDISNLFSASRAIKDRYNDLSSTIIKITEEALAWTTTKTEEERLSNLTFTADLSKGWYQNLKGELYHYDGVIWDVVPKERLTDLEYLG